MIDKNCPVCRGLGFYPVEWRPVFRDIELRDGSVEVIIEKYEITKVTLCPGCSSAIPGEEKKNA